MRRIFENFDRTYIINLEERTDRRQDVVAEFAALGIEIPNDKIRFFTPAGRPETRKSFPTPGARGSFASHRAVLDMALADSLNNVLIVEDDIFLKSVKEGHLNEIIQQLNVIDWDIVYLGYLEPAILDGPGSLTRWDGETIGGHFYAVNRDYMQKMSKYMHDCEARPPGHPLGGPMFRDGAYNHFRHLYKNVRIFLATPNLAEQRSSRTDIHTLSFFDRIKLFHPFIDVGRIAKNRLRQMVG